MRIENVSGQKYTSATVQGADKASLPQLKRGDSFTAKVVDVSRDGATLKLADGQVIRARVEGGAQLFPGQDVEMQVAGNDGGTLTLRVIETLGGEAQAPVARGPASAAEPADVRQAAAAASLKSLNLPVTRQTVAAALRIMDKLPQLDPDKAAFLAASGIPEEMLTTTAVARLFGTDAGEMLAQLSGMLEEAAGPPGVPEAALPAQRPDAQAPQAEPAQAPGLPQGEAPQPQAPVPQAAMPQAVSASAAQPSHIAPQAEATPLAAGPESALATAPAFTPAEAAAPRPEEARPEGVPAQRPEADAQAPATQNGGAVSDSAQATARLEAAVQLVRQFAENPQIFAAGEGRAAAFSQMFQEAAAQVARIVAAPAQEQAALLKDFIDDMFVRIDKWSDDAPALVKKARDELLTRLTLVQETVTGTSIGSRAEVARQAGGLARHVQVLEEIGQFGYVQIPINQGGRQKTAEMYIYRDKRRGKRIDPDNVKILLALDTQSMGHLQAFVAIRQKEVSVRLDVEKQQWADYIRMRSPDLHSMLDEAGYRLAENRIGVREKPVTVERAMAALLEYDPRLTGIDVKV